MSKAALKPITKKSESAADLITKQQRALKSGKAGYKKSDAKLDKLEALIKAGELKLDEWVKLPNGDEGRVIDRFATTNKVGYGGAARRYEVEVRSADGVKK
jgi:hypothetical protein